MISIVEKTKMAVLMCFNEKFSIICWLLTVLLHLLMIWRLSSACGVLILSMADEYAASSGSITDARQVGNRAPCTGPVLHKMPCLQGLMLCTPWRCQHDQDSHVLKSYLDL